MSRITIFLLVILTFYSCDKNQKNYNLIKWNRKFLDTSSTKKKNYDFWYLKDINDDSIPGISLAKAYKDGLINKSKKEIVIAILDTEIDIDHSDLKNNIWKNKKEIQNGIDDDDNGYIDDIKGWNFLGNSNGGNLIYSSDESVRIIRAYEDKPADFFISKMLHEKAMSAYQKNQESVKSDYEYVSFLKDTYPKSKKALKKFFPKEDYSITQLDSLYEIYSIKDEELADLIYYMSDYLKYDLSAQWIEDYESTVDNLAEKTYNLEYTDRQVQGDDEYNIGDKIYGNNSVNSNLEHFYHGTEVAGLIVSKYDSINKIRGVCDTCKIMPVCISGIGNEHDKDMALGIRYAVDNGANIINMSIGKDLSLNNSWVLEALKYASDKNVLVVSSAGNSSYNLDIVNDNYPDDNVDNGPEVSDTFVLVGCSTNQINENLIADYSNYGKYDVDLFAPGESIITTMPFNEFKLDGGTSLSSAIVSGLAGLLWSRYPDLTASGLKEILTNSGVEYDLEVKTYSDNEEQTRNFKDLSKSGRVVNAYNSFIVADSISNSIK